MGTPLHRCLIALCCAAGWLTTGAGGQPKEQSASVTDSPDEITVTGQRSLGALERDLGTATERFWELVNAALADPQFEVTCERVVSTGTRISERMCMTRFARDEITQWAQWFLRGVPDDPQPRIALKNRELNRRMVEALNTRPELRAAVEELARLKQQYLDESARRRAD
jgi:hypothetical protein